MESETYFNIKVIFIMKTGKIIIILIVIAIPLTWWGFVNFNQSEHGLPPLHTEQVDRGDVSQRVIAHGSIKPVQTVIVGSQVSGIIEDIYVDFNSVVTRGEVVAQIDPSTFEAEVSSARAELESAEAGKELARMQWERVQELRERQFVAPSETDQARATLQQAEAQVRVRRHALERAQRELDRTTILSPTNGIVISRNIEVGQTVAASLSAPLLFEIATDLSVMQIHANVSEADIGMVQEGQRVEFQVDAYRNRLFTGEVIQVRNAPLIEDNVVHYETIIAVNNEERLLKPGMTAEVSVITDERENVMRVRNTALRARLPDNIRPADVESAEDMDGQVYLVQGDQLIAKAVRTGLSDGVYTEIIEGLELGDELAVGLSLRSQDQGERRSLFSGNQAQY